MFPLKYQHGYTLVEALVVIAIASLLVIGLATFMGRSFNISREQFEQVRITEDARLEMERISDAIRNARYIDLNGNGLTDESNETWLQAGDAYAITVFTNIDDDASAERVRYFIETNDPRLLKRGVVEAPFTGSETVSVLIRSLHNFEQTTPIFTYYGNNGEQIPVPVSGSNFAAAARVGITLVVDSDPGQIPGAATVTTDVTPRSSVCDAGNCQGVGTGCVDIPDIPLGPYPYSTSNFIENGGQTCKAYCQTPGATSCCPWGAAYSWDGANTVSGTCSCGQPTYPSPLPDVVSYGDYTQYYKSKWEYCAAIGQFGIVACDPTCELLPNSTGRCTWECQADPSPTPTPTLTPSPSPSPDTSPSASPSPDGSPSPGASPSPGNEPEPPVITQFSVSGGSVHTHAPVTHGCYNHSHYVVWQAINATSCTAGGVWSGTYPVSGVATVQASGNGVFTITCVGPGGEDSASVPMVTDQFVACI